ncbi:MAG: TolC family protein [candidate division Zixibacteria bacterium]|nr:TolC family protein [candidate division Zixibacteria bacterium]
MSVGQSMQTKIVINGLRSRMKITRVTVLSFVLVFIAALPLQVSADQVKLTVNKVRQQALTFNRSYLAALEEVIKAEGDVTKARAGAFPTIELTGGYLRSFKIPKMYYEANGETREMQFGYKNSFSTGLSLRQSIFQGGKVFTAYSIAKDYKKYAQALADQSQSELVYNAEILFYSAILEQSHLEVLEKALDASNCNLDVIEKRFSQGLMSEFEVLRARVKKNNLLPQILAVESEVRMSKKRLKSFLGIKLNADVLLIEDMGDTSLQALPSLEEHMRAALEGRSEVQQASKMVDMRKRAIRIAKGDYYPSASAFLSYDLESVSDNFSLSDNTSTSWTAGLSLTIPIFQGGARGGKVSISKADYRQTLLARDQLQDDIRLEVEEAYDHLLQAKKTLDIQVTNIAEAETGLRIANLRYESGVGILLEVLSAQAALTEARNAQAEALFMFRQAKSQLKKASTL